MSDTKRPSIRITLTRQQRKALQPLVDWMFENARAGNLGASYGQISDGAEVATFSFLNSAATDAVIAIIEEDLKQDEATR